MTQSTHSATHSSATHEFIEGGLLYPTGYLVAAFPDGESALLTQRNLIAGGYDTEHDCIYATPEAVAAEAAHEVLSSGMLALFGHSLQVRETHLQLAREGCHFLTIHAPTAVEQKRVIKVLSRVPVRHAVKYHLLAIENITDLLPSAVGEPLSAWDH
jgi:hypothetical protein